MKQNILDACCGQQEQERIKEQENVCLIKLWTLEKWT